MQKQTHGSNAIPASVSISFPSNASNICSAWLIVEWKFPLASSAQAAEKLIEDIGLDVQVDYENNW